MPPLPPRADAGASRGARTVLPGQSPEGEYILSVLVKRTFDIVPGHQCTLAAEDRALNPADMHWDDPMNSSVRYESDFIPFKPETDIVFEGVAHVPGGSANRTCTVSVRVGQHGKSIAVIGDRVARYVSGGVPVFTDPVPFVSMEMRYERAYGGIDVYSDPKVSYPYPRNPLGRGFAVRNTRQSVDNRALPNLEDPGALLTPAMFCLGEYAAWESRPMPAGVGWFPKTWLPRALLAGIMPADRGVERELRHAYAKLLPTDQRDAYLNHGIGDMDFRFFNGASFGLAVPHLEGGEWVTADNLSRSGRVRFQLPTSGPRIGLDLGEGVEEPEVVLQTVMIRIEDAQIDLVWRGAVPYPGPEWLPEMRKLDVLIA